MKGAAVSEPPLPPCPHTPCVGLNSTLLPGGSCDVSQATVSYSLSAWHSHTP